jgi:hypothetical protein
MPPDAPDTDIEVIDLLVIGRPDRDDLHDAVGRARSRLGRDINCRGGDETPPDRPPRPGHVAQAATAS